MKQNIADWLPIGSVVKLKKAEKRLMVIGVQQKKEKESEEIYDYSGVVYPEGYFGNGGIFVFNQEDIEKISYLGFHDLERQLMMAALQRKIEGVQ